MRKLKLSSLIVTTVALTAVLLPMGSSNADTVGAAVFHGWAVVSPHICVPLAPGCGGAGKKGPGATLGFVFGAGEKQPDPKGILSVCAGAAVSPKKSSDPFGPLCDIAAAGVITQKDTGTGPWCGNSNGAGAGTLTYSKTKVIDTVFTWISKGTILLVQGEASKGDQKSDFTLVVEAVADSTNSSCTNKVGPDHFRVTGEALSAAQGAKG